MGAKIRLGQPQPTKQWQARNRLGELPEMATAALLAVTQAFTEALIPHWLTYGALLGLIREGRLLPHDGDIDFAVAPDVAPERVIDALASCGFTMTKSTSIGGSAGNYKFQRDRIVIDVYHLTVDGAVYRDHYLFDEHSVCSGTHPKMGTKLLTWSGHEIPIPSDPEVYLAHLYGHQWRVPVLRWDWRFSPPNGTIHLHWRSAPLFVHAWLKFNLLKR